MSSRQEKFASKIYQAARRAGLNDTQARLAASQASLETGYGKSVKGNNFFGIKAGSSWKGKSQTFKTWEDYGKGRVNIKDKFRAYDSVEDSVRDWAKLIENKYPDAWRAPDVGTAAKKLVSGTRKYATDPKYANKVSYIDRKFVGKNPKGAFTGTAGIDEDFYKPIPTPKPNPDFRYAAVPTPKPAEETQMVANPAPRPVKTTRIGADPRDVNERNFANAWNTPDDLLTAFSKSRAAIGVPTGEGSTPLVTPAAPIMAASAPTVSKQAGKAVNQAQDRINNVWGRVPQEKTPLVSQVGGAPAIRPGYNPSTSKSVNAQSRIDKTFAQIPERKTVYSGGDAQRAKSMAAYQQYGASRAAATPQAQPQTRTVKTIEYRPTRVAIAPSGKANTGGMSLDQAGEFAFGPTSMNVRQMNADAFGQNPTPAPMPTPKPQYKMVMKPVTTYAQVPIPAVKPTVAPQVEQPQSLFGKLFNPAGMVGGLAGSMIGGPIGGLVGSMAGRTIANNMGGNGSSGSRSGGFTNGSHDDGRRYNPTSGQYVDSRGNRSSNQSLGSGGSFATIRAIANKISSDFGGGSSSGGGGCFITTAAVDVMGETDNGGTLKTLRWFRDHVMRKRPDWAKDIEAYYQIAPGIVASLKGNSAAYREIYEATLLPAANAIRQGQFDLAYTLYKNMVFEQMRAANGNQSYSGA